MIYKYGSPPQHETFDPKPDAPVEIRGEFGTVAVYVLYLLHFDVPYGVARYRNDPEVRLFWRVRSGFNLVRESKAGQIPGVLAPGSYAFYLSRIAAPETD